MGSGNIHEFWVSCKSVADDFFHNWGLITVIALLGASSFALGRLSALEASKPAISVTQAPVGEYLDKMAQGGYVVAARTGSVYYFPWCGQVDSIAASDQVWFRSESEARGAGYRAAKNCKGM